MIKKVRIALPILLLAVFIIGMYRVMNRHMGRGDYYPPYSALRHDPMGTSLFINSLKRMGDRVTLLTQEVLPETPEPEKSILFMIAPQSFIDKDTCDWITGFILNGGRVVMTARATNSLMKQYKTTISLSLLGGENGQGHYTASPCQEFSFLNEALPVHHPASLLSEWSEKKTVYQIDGQRDTMILIAHGKGDILIASDSYFISNESLVREPPVTLLTWIVDNRPYVLVDEFHHGVVSQMGIGFLLKRYKLYWFIAYLILIASLYLWHMLPGFRKPVPMPFEEKGWNAVTPLAGYAALLSKTVPKKRLLETCVEEWSKGGRERAFAERKETIVNLLDTPSLSMKHERDEHIIGMYNEITKIIDDRSLTWTSRNR